MSNVTDPNESEDIRVLRTQAGEATANAARAEAAERRIAFLEAGVDTTSDIGVLFVDAYKGELTTDAIVAAATKVNALRPAPVAATPPAGEGQTPPATPPATPTQTYNPVEAAMQQLAQQGVQGEIPGGARTPDPDPDPVEHGFEEFTRSMQAGRRREDAATHVLFGVLEAAGKGDPRVLFDPERDRQGTFRNIKVPNTTMGL